MTNTILVYGASGAQMGPGTEFLISAGHKVRVFTRSVEKAAEWKAKGAEPIIGDMSDYDVMRRASEGCDALFLLIPTFRGSDALGATFGLNAIKAAADAGIKKVIWNTAGPLPDEGSEAAETSSGWQVLREMKAQGISYLGLQPLTYMENLFGPWNTIRMADGVVSYPTPPEFKMQWVAARDFGVVADAALTGALPNEIIRLGGPAALDGNDVTNAFVSSLGGEFSYQMTPVETFQPYLEQSGAMDVAAMIGGLYAAIQAAPQEMQPGFILDADAIADRFGIKLTSLEDWITMNRVTFASSV